MAPALQRGNTAMTTTHLKKQGPGLLRLHAWLVVVTVALTVAAAMALAGTRPHEVTASAKVLALATPTASGPPLPVDMGTEREVATSGQVADLAAADLATNADDAQKGLSVSVVTDT